MSDLVRDKVVIVTGGAAGIGRAAAVAFAEEGAQVAVGDIDDTGGAATVELIRAAGGEAAFFHCDTAREDDIAALVAGASTTFGRIDCALNNVGVGHAQVRLGDIERGDWDRTLAVNLTGTWLCMKHEIAQLIRQGTGGAIVNTSSSSSQIGWPLTAAYAATKAAINQLVRSAAAEYAVDGIRVNAILPGPTRTESMAQAAIENPGLEPALTTNVPMGRLGTPAETAALAVFLCSDRAGYITGATLPVDGGQLAV